MPTRLKIIGTAAIVLGVLFVLPVAAKTQPSVPAASTALRDYVNRPDKSYAWRERQRGKFGGGEYVELILTSQTWHDIVWKHQLFIYRPAKIKSESQALLLIDGGSWNDKLDAKPDESKPESLPEKVQLIAIMADMLQAPVVVVRQVPEQPLFDGRKEDQIIALTFTKFFETGEPDWPLLMPMVKTVVRAMDTAQEVAKKDWQLNIEHFIVTGASKRGWTTWLTAATDSRVNALAPMVINMLNMGAHDKLQLESFGGYSEQIKDYTQRGLQEKLFTEKGATLQAIVDPFVYRKQLLQPKLIILATNDAYWPVDALNLYWNELQGDKYLLFVPNNGHGITDYPRVVASIAALESSITGGKPMPKLAWRLDQQSDPVQFELSSDVKPLAVRQWNATAETRDFRQSLWTATPVAAKGGDGGKFVAELQKPAKGYKATFLEAEFPGEATPFVLCTTLHVIGDAAANTASNGGVSQ